MVIYFFYVTLIVRFQRLLKSGASVRVIFGELDSDENGYVTIYEWLAKGGDKATFRGLLERFDANGIYIYILKYFSL